MTSEQPTLNMREKLAHIDQLLADIDRQRIADFDHKHRYAPALLVVAGMTMGAALFGAGAGVGAMLVKLYAG